MIWTAIVSITSFRLAGVVTLHTHISFWTQTAKLRQIDKFKGV